MTRADRTPPLVLEPEDRQRLFETLIDSHVPSELQELFRRLAAARRGPFELPALESSPKVSCVMVTKNAIELAARAVEDYARQTWANRELVVVLDASSPERELRALATELGRSDVRFLEAKPGARIGALRNAAHDACTGSVLCQWDDDDRHHPERVSEQLRLLVEHDAQACYLQEVFHLIGTDLFWANWSAAPLCCHPGTMMVRRASAPRYVDAAARSEDAYFFCMLAGRVVLSRGAPELYAYAYHGSNSWDESHHRSVALGLSLPAAALARERAFITGAVKEIGLPDPLRVVGSDGVAFECGAR